MTPPRIDQINVVVGDVDAAARFLTELGVDLPEGPEEWAPHHRSVPTATAEDLGRALVDGAFEVDLDSSAFAHQWGGLAPDHRGVVLNVRVDERSDVDRLHDLALSVGGQSRRMPYDAFWGSRFAVVEGPGPISIGIMSMPDDVRRTAPPDPASLP